MKTIGKYRIITYRHSRVIPDAISIGVVFIVPNSKFPLVFKRISSFSNITKLYKQNEHHFISSFLRVFQDRIEEINESAASEQKDLFLNVDQLDELVTKILPPNSGAFFIESAQTLVFNDLESDIDYFTNQIIGHHLNNETSKPRIDDAHLKRSFQSQLKSIEATKRNNVKIDYSITTENTELVFDFAWLNGQVNVLSAAGFDYADDSSISEKGHKWFSWLYQLSTSQAKAKPTLIISEPSKEHHKTFNQAIKLIKSAPSKPIFLEENELADYAKEIEKEAKPF